MFFPFPMQGFCIITYLDGILVIIHSVSVGKRAWYILCSLLVCPWLHINFFKSKHHLTQYLCPLDCFGIQWICQYLCHLKNFKRYSIWLIPSWRQPVTVCKIMSLLGKTNICANGHAQLCQVCCVIKSVMLNVYSFSNSLISFFSPFSFSSISASGIISVTTNSISPAICSSWCHYH